MFEISFRGMTEGDLPLVAAWLREEHVQRWWRDPSAADNVESEYLPRINGIEPTEMLIVLRDGTEIGMIQRYRMSDHPDWELSLACTGVTFMVAAGIDYVIGVRDLVGRGIGSVVVAAFSAEVFARYPEVDQIVVTPQVANRASCRVLEKAGYLLTWTGMLDSDDPSDSGTAALYVLDRSPLDS
ncbi:MAG: acetyltransferase [Acidimicrobiia bacterium]|nr:acetyltransferase [Acidimicrobiia bacterium]